jgi:hypothetical protein
MKVLFASGDVGGARVLLPVIESCIRKDLSIVVIDNGHITKEAPKDWERLSPERFLSSTQARAIFEQNEIGLLVFSSSVKDTIPLTLARRARESGIPVFHILDNWTGYRERMETDGFSTFSPDRYIVMDHIAYEDALEAGIEKSTLLVQGHPALSTLSKDYSHWKAENEKEVLKQYGFDSVKERIAFISEPVEQDQGATSQSPTFRGYTEEIVLRLFCGALQPFSEKVQIIIFPHPREDAARLGAYWSKYKGSLDGMLLKLERGREAVFLSNGVAGMASILLYEAWLLGKPVISIQPGLRLKPLRMLGRREAITFVDSYSGVKRAITEWVRGLLDKGKNEVRPELYLNEDASETVCELIQEHLKKEGAESI